MYFSWFPRRLLAALVVSTLSCLVLIIVLMSFPACAPSYLCPLALTSLGIFSLGSGLHLVSLIGRLPP
jgi:uncharacterized membrane protein